MTISVLDERIRAAGIPIHGVSDNGDGTYRVDFAAGATAQQQSDAAVIVAAFDPVAEQVILDAEEAGKVAAQTGAKAWYLANPNAALLFDLSIDGLMAEIDSLDFAALPAATRNKLKLLLKTLSVAVRVLARREGLT